MSAHLKQEASLKIANTVCNFDIFKNSEIFAAYLAFHNEVDPAPIINCVWQKHKACYVPFLKNNEMLFVKYEQEDELIKNHYGILEPVFNANKVISPKEIDLVITPLVGFDTNGNRLGAGGGYYDRTFDFLKNSPRKKPYLLGIAYDFQKLQNFTPQKWDVPLNMIVTEKNIYSCASSF